MTTDRYVDATACDAERRLTETQVAAWRETGHALVSGLLPNETVRAVAGAAADAFPAAGTDAARRFVGFGSRGDFVFPSEHEAFNALVLDPRLLDAVARLLDVPVTELRLTQADLWPKYGDADGGLDQRIHVDYPNHTLTHPAPWSRPEAVELIVYLSDHAETGGATAVVPREGPDDPAYRWPIVDSPGIGDLAYVNDRADAEPYFAEQRPELAAWRETLYARERYARFRPGDVLLYRHDTWHRGTPMRDGALRFALNVTFRKASAEWISTLHTGWAWQLYRPSRLLNRLIAGADLPQRAVLGFPQPGSDYWCEETLAAVTARYGMYGFDPAPYRAALGGARAAVHDPITKTRSTKSMETRTVRNGEVELHSYAAGEGPVILCVHGWPELGYSWRHQQAYFAERGWRVVAMDVRGYGASSKPEPIEAYTMRELASDVVAVARAWSDEPVVLFGHDWGAPIVYATTLLHPERIRAVAGLSVPFSPPSEFSFLDMAAQLYAGRFFYQLYFEAEGVVEAEVEADMRGALRRIYFGLSGDAPLDHWLRERPATETLLQGLEDPDPFPSWMTEGDLDVYAAAFEAGGFRGPINRYRAQRLDVEQLAAVRGRTIPQPACFVGGERDAVRHFVPGGDLYADPGASFEDFRGATLVPDAGHWVQQEAPAAVNAALEAFLDGLDG